MLIYSLVRYMNRDGKRFENLDQMIRHLVSSGQHEDEILQVRFFPICRRSYQSTIRAQIIIKLFPRVIICEYLQMKAELTRDGWFWKEGLPKGWLFKKTVSKITFLTPKFLRCNSIQQVYQLYLCLLMLTNQ